MTKDIELRKRFNELIEHVFYYQKEHFFDYTVLERLKFSAEEMESDKVETLAEKYSDLEKSALHEKVYKDKRRKNMSFQSLDITELVETVSEDNLDWFERELCNFDECPLNDGSCRVHDIEKTCLWESDSCKIANILSGE